MADKPTPYYEKDTILYQVLFFIAGLIVVVQESELIMGYLGEGAGYVAMASSVIAIGLSFTKRRPIHLERLEVLEDTEVGEDSVAPIIKKPRKKPTSKKKGRLNILDEEEEEL